MPSTPAFPTACRRAAFIAVVLGTVAPGVQAQPGAGGEQAPDHVLVVARTVHPRIAYRGIPLEDHPVHTQATVFPGGVFHRTLDASMERLVGDAELVQLGSLGIERGVGPALTVGRLGMAGPGLVPGGGAGAATPLRSGAGGVVSAVTSAPGSLLQISLVPSGPVASGLVASGMIASGMIQGATYHCSVVPVIAKSPGGGP